MHKKSLLNSAIGPNADMVARYRFISKGDNVDGFYGGNSFANQIGITTQVPRVVEIVSNNTNSSDREELIATYDLGIFPMCDYYFWSMKC